MVPFEPKIDSKEFEVANPEQSPSSGTRSAASEAADLTIRIWRKDNAAALTWSSESVLVYMIADLVSASRGRTAVEVPVAMAAHFDNSLHALVAAKRIQTAILEFLACRPGDYVGAAVLIHPPAAAGFSQGMAQSALRYADPGQIILSEEVQRRFQDLPGIELRAVPALTTDGNEPTGLSELVWTSAERLASLRHSAALPSPTANVGPPVGATMIVNAPFATPRTDAGKTSAQPLSEIFGTGEGNQSASVSGEWKNRDGAFEPPPAEFPESRSFLTPSRMLIGAIALVLVGAGLVLFHPWSSPKVQPPAHAMTGATPGSAAETPASTLPQPAAQPVVEPPPVVKSPNKKQVDKAAKDKEKTKKPEVTVIQGFEGNSTYDGMTQKDIPQLLRWARSDAGNGNYAKAAQEYRVILQLQPSNPDAREGLRKIQVARGRDQ